MGSMRDRTEAMQYFSWIGATWGCDIRPLMNRPGTISEIYGDGRGTVENAVEFLIVVAVSGEVFQT